MQDKSKSFSIPVPDIMFTDSCNFRCKYCFEKKNQHTIETEKMKQYIRDRLCLEIYIFGGEPLIVLDTLIEILDEIDNLEDISEERKLLLLHSAKKITTNGSLIKKYKNKLKKYGFEVQISCDGPKEIHDANRIYADGRPTYDDVFESIQICKKNKIAWAVHGVVGKNTICKIFDIFKWFWEVEKLRAKNIEQAIFNMGNNEFQIIFEEDYDDNDVNEIIKQFHKIIEWIYNCEELTEEQRKKLFNRWMERKGGICGVGTGLMAIDYKFDIYPCHRLAAVEDKGKYKLGNVYDIDSFSNFALYNLYFRVAKRDKLQYSAYTVNNAYNDSIHNWFNWCPSTNIQESKGNPYYISAKYSIMHNELNQALHELKELYFPEVKKLTW